MTDRDFGSSRRRIAAWPARVGWGLALFALTPLVTAGTFAIRPIDFGDGIVAQGTLTTTGSTADIVDWSLTVETHELLARYTQANTSMVEATLVSSGAPGLTVGTSVDPVNDPGGVLRFRSPNPFLDFGVTLADFSVAGGQAMYMAGGNFDTLGLGHSGAGDHLAATSRTPGGILFDLVPLHFADGVTLTGTITTDGSTGSLNAADLLGWDLRLEQITLDVFNPANSTLQAQGVGITPDQAGLTLAIPDGTLQVTKGFLGGRLYALQLADFSDSSSPGGQAGYFQGRLAIHTVDLGAGPGPWRLTGTEPVAASDAGGSLSLVLLGALGVAVGRSYATRGDRR